MCIALVHFLEGKSTQSEAETAYVFGFIEEERYE